MKLVLLVCALLFLSGCGPSREAEYRRILQETETMRQALNAHDDESQNIANRSSSVDPKINATLAERDHQSSVLRSRLKELEIQLDIAKARLR